MNEDHDFGRTLKEYRKKNNMTQAQLANLLGKSPSTIYGYETNQIIPSVDIVCMISSILSVEIEKLLGLSKPIKSKESLMAGYLIRFGNRLELGNEI